VALRILGGLLADLRAYITLNTKMHHFRDTLSSQSFSTEQKKLNPTQQKLAATTNRRITQQK